MIAFVTNTRQQLRLVSWSFRREVSLACQNIVEMIKPITPRGAAMRDMTPATHVPQHNCSNPALSLTPVRRSATSASLMQSLPIVQTALEQFHKLVRSHDAAKLGQNCSNEDGKEISSAAPEIIEEAGRCMIMKLPGGKLS